MVESSQTSRSDRFDKNEWAIGRKSRRKAVFAFGPQKTYATPAFKYFTAPILTAFAKSDDSVSCQAQYHSALDAHLGAELEIVKGYYDARLARAHTWKKGKAARECAMIDVWKLEEKQSDVALAVHAFSDAVRTK